MLFSNCKEKKQECLVCNECFLVSQNTIDVSSSMRGHGTYSKDQQLVSSVAGCVERVNRLVSVRPLNTRYHGEIGDVVVGRVIEVQSEHKRWKIDTGSRLDSILLLSSVNLPGGELRRKTVKDELAMKQFLKEGDLISAEVQSIFSDGSLSLHTRNLKYGKLGQGIILKVSPSLVERRKTHFHNLSFGASLILGNNGYIWVSECITEGNESGGWAVNVNPVALSVRQTMSRLRNIIILLAKNKMTLNVTSISYAFELSLNLDLEVNRIFVIYVSTSMCKLYLHVFFQVRCLLENKTMEEIAILTKQRMGTEK